MHAILLAFLSSMQKQPSAATENGNVCLQITTPNSKLFLTFFEHTFHIDWATVYMVKSCHIIVFPTE